MASATSIKVNGCTCECDWLGVVGYCMHVSFSFFSVGEH